ncbi:MAG: hypothetical protein Q8916_09165 [Bacteroidota bacterium]|nr:hypothetical protein [Bacteroidota bacterium]MDP4230556.1 hypothetical protein [Bacteroidota bacterium]MDP4236687.1 hypothetical protein [Bacteroidota bacterium]
MLKFATPFLVVTSFLFIPFLQHEADLNLGFEQRIHQKPRGWYSGGGGRTENDLDGYLGVLDSVTKHSGKYSLYLKYLHGDGFGGGRIQFPSIASAAK